jgi:hypothetical protein
MSSRPPQKKPVKAEYRDKSSSDTVRKNYPNFSKGQKLPRQTTVQKDRSYIKGKSQVFVAGRTNFKGPKFVKPYPMKPYMSKSGNGLSKEIEEWFKGYCSKCGHFSHRMADCKTYPEKGTCLSLCCVCRQGMHDVCRSKRGDLVKNNATSQIVKKLEKKVDYFQGQLAIQNHHPVFQPTGGVYYGPPHNYFPAARGNVKNTAYTGTDDEEN